MSDAKTNVSQPGKKSGALIYVVDDEPMLLELADVILSPEGYKILTFRDPENALKNFTNAATRPDLLITDYAMHTMNGMQLIEKFRQIEPRQKILLVSGTVGEEIFGDSEHRPNKFLAKPYLTGQLIAAVKNLLAAN
jgi:CheY-like chemotaxis protein